MVVRELIAKLGFDVDTASLAKAEKALAGMTRMGEKAASAVQRTKTTSYARTPGMLSPIPGMSQALTAKGLSYGPLIAQAEKAARAAQKVGDGIAQGMATALPSVQGVTDALGAQVAKLRAEAAAMKTAEYRKFAEEQRKLKKEIDDTNRSLDKQGQSAKGAESGLMSMVRTGAMVAAAAYTMKKAFDGIMYAVSEAADFESLNAEFEVMLKNADAAKYLVQEIQAFAMATPFKTKGLVENVRLLMSFGESAKSSLDAVKMLGDVAGSSQEKLNRLSLAYAQTMSRGKLQGQDLLQFVDAGFNPLKEISRTTDKSMKQLQDDMGKGLISAQMVTEAFKAATSEGGLYYQNTLKQSQTLNGLWSTLVDGFEIMAANLGGLLIPAIKAVIVAFLPMMDDIAGAFRQLGDFFLLFFTGGPEAETTARSIATAFMTIADVIMLVMTYLQALWTFWQFWATGVSLLVGGIVDAIMAIPKAFAYVRKGLAKILIGVGMASGNTTLTKLGASWERSEDEKIGGGMFAGVKTAWATGTAGESLSKTLKLASMIGQSKAAPAGSKVPLSESVLAAINGRAPVSITTNNNNQSVHNNVTVNADDTLKTAAESMFGKVFQAQLIQLRAATV